MPLQMIDTWLKRSNLGAVSAQVRTISGVVAERHAGAAEAHSLYALASLTKPLVALAVMIAVEEGALDLEAPVADHLAEFATAEKRAITARHLLSHASGLPEIGPRGVASLDVAPVRPPATRRVYSNEGYAVLGALLSAATEIPYATYVREAVFEPLEIDAFLGLPESEAHRALKVREPGLAGDGSALFNSRAWRERATAAGGAFATVDGYGRFAALLLDQGRPLIARETFDQMTAVAFPGLPGGIESFQVWDDAPWSLGCDVRGHKTPHYTGDPHIRRHPLALRCVGHALLRRSPRRRRAHLPGRPQHLLRMDHATRRVAGSVRRGARSVDRRVSRHDDWAFCPRCTGLLGHAPDESQEQRLQCPRCGLVLYDNPAPTAGAIVVRDDSHVLLVRRARPPGEACWMFRADLSSPARPASRRRSASSARRRGTRSRSRISWRRYLTPTAAAGSTFNLYFRARVVGGREHPADDVSEIAWTPLTALPPRNQIAFANVAAALERALGLPLP